MLPEGRLTRTTPYPNLFASGKPIFEMVAPTDNMWQSQIFKSSVIKGLIKIGTDEEEKLAVNFA